MEIKMVESQQTLSGDKRRLIISVHDVTPKYKGELSEIVTELDRIGIVKRSLLVVPNWEGKYDLRNDDNFVSWLHDLQQKGDEIVCHGYNHQSEKRQGYYHNASEWFMGELFARGTGEFQNVTYQEARCKIKEAKKVFSDVKLENVTGFVAPAWLVNADVEKALDDESFWYHISTTFWDYVGQLSKISIKNIRTGEIKCSREVTFDGSRAIIDYGTRALAWLITRNKKAPDMRIAIHPQDIHASRPFEYALQLIEEVKEGRETMAYRELFSP